MKRIIGLLGLSLLISHSYAATFKEELYQIYEGIYKKKVPQLSVDIDFIDYKEFLSRSQYDWHASFYLSREIDGLEERIGMKVFELGEVNLKNFKKDPLESDLPFDQRKSGLVNLKTSFNLNFYNQLGDQYLFNFPFLEEVELNGIVDRNQYLFKQMGEIKKQTSPIVIDGINFGSIGFNQFMINSTYQFSPKFKQLNDQNVHYKIDDLVIDTFNHDKSMPILITAGSVIEKIKHNYQQHNYNFDLTLKDVAYSDEERHFELDNMQHQYRVKSDDNGIEAITFKTQSNNIRMHDERCSNNQICSLGDTEISTMIKHLNEIDYKRFSRGLSQFKQFIAADSFYSLTSMDLKTQLKELGVLMGEALSADSEFTCDASFKTKGEANLSLYLKPSEKLKIDLQELKDESKSKNIELCDEGIDRCIDRYIDQFDLSLTLSDRYFYDLYSLFLISTNKDLSEKSAREKARIAIRNLMFVNLFLSANDLTLLERKNKGISIEIHYKKNEWTINGKTFKTKTLTEIGI